ncbi:hypothetical protein SAMN04487948_11935 [Halogranum amylolyticum]|uniref:Uncharacterized protein n=1 Tax=Halogranum amylolyticum TaxID=660520 RepID=A0A1H8VSE4_9EURY|nr:hypothetical protein [Halogranum amylolyticum]SEP18349.1 hypothetical protein SAMN04487948_11935 [Halogranum amylolyticum]
MRDVFDKFGWKQESEPPSYEIRGERLEEENAYVRKADVDDETNPSVLLSARKVNPTY